MSKNTRKIDTRNVARIGFRHTPDLWFDPNGLELNEGDVVIVRTERGEEMGFVHAAPAEIADETIAKETKEDLPRVIRIATEDDMIFSLELREREKEALIPFRELIEKSGLDMKPVEVEYLFGGDKIIFYFSSEHRVDFRQLVRELASHFHARIEMRQIGSRDQARLVGGLGNCGDVLCCARMSGEFKPVSIRMAKEQGLPPNPAKIAGACGRLMCCLRYEVDAYKDFNRRAPKKGAMIETPKGEAKVRDLNALKELVTLQFRGKEGEKSENLVVPLGSMVCGKGKKCDGHGSEGGCCANLKEGEAPSRPCKITKEAFAELTPDASDDLDMPAVAFKDGPTLESGGTPGKKGGGAKRSQKRGKGGQGDDKPGESSEDKSRKRRSRGGRGRRNKRNDGKPQGNADKPQVQPKGDSDVYVKQATRVPRRRRSS